MIGGGEAWSMAECVRSILRAYFAVVRGLVAVWAKNGL